MLSLILAQHISQQKPAVHVIHIGGWNPSVVRTAGGWRAYLVRVQGWVPGEKTVLIFDRARETYQDFDLWSEFFKNLPAYDDQFVIAFASYGSPTSRLNMQGNLFCVSDSQRVTLRPIDHGDGLGAVGLLFSRTEFDDLVRIKFASPENYFDPSFFKAVFKITGGHVGAIHDFVNIVSTHDVRFFMMSEQIT